MKPWHVWPVAKKRKEKTTYFSVILMRSQVLYQAAQPVAQHSHTALKEQEEIAGKLTL